ncbi:hypothetical protein [Streptosporangium sp. NPDC049644]|uniref:hypothetical protein n=1 Tax=Streptosporangium sp. NPDC049644 TaxID=3155507 RepID=UPI00341E41F4
MRTLPETGPVFLTDRKARPSVALVDVDPRTSRARLSYRRAAEVFDTSPTYRAGRNSGLTHAASTPMLVALFGHISVRSLTKYARVSAEALGRWQAERDPAGRRVGGRR